MELDERVIVALASGGVWGSLPTWILVAVALLVAYRVTRGGAGSAVAELSTANRVLEKRVHELGGEVRDLKIENAELRAKTDVTLAIEPAVERMIRAIESHEERALGELAKHEQRAIERHDQVLKNGELQIGILQLVADRLGPEQEAA